ncbi:flagellar biosynthesis protein FlhB [Hyphobacterium sp. HN65]|uniref:Flagellar biosynthetic protein FlhB n=1 Tax=Hyphobacterium lacteum TaxID=3116575 RepID=A0ABU7LQJ7_9PROT|nr:flagellar biosynthesis protein FlhB [Hyphobacterium sp. HN65]MEE2526172.1 flagellar biosynthesis protein FlhB [Hyphobacterium sp. HN65]
MAEDQDESQKTEEPTPRRLQDARKKGDVPKSQEVPGWFVLASGLVVIGLMAPGAARALSSDLSLFLGNAHALSLEPSALRDQSMAIGWRVVSVVGMAIGVIALAGLAGHLLQTGLLFTTEKMQPKLSKLNPAEGFKRMFGPQGIANFLKGVGKLVIVSAAVFVVIWPKRGELAGMPMLDLSALLTIIRNDVLLVLVAALVAYAFIAAADYVFQRQSFMKRNRMSRREIKDELKQSEGDPQVRARLRQIRQERANKRMMANVPDATVVITNPTHFAVALKYEQGETPAPICVAKGVDQVALNIREIAGEHDVPIVEDPPLARALFASVEVDETIPAEHFQAVAKVIGYVLTLTGKRAQNPQPG